MVTVVLSIFTGYAKKIFILFSDKKIIYTPERRPAIGVIHLGTSEATAPGAYAYALNQL